MIFMRRRLKVVDQLLNVGFLGGDGLCAFAHFIEILDPYNHLQRIVGFDSFQGFPERRLKVEERVGNNSQPTGGGLEKNFLMSLSTR